MSYANMNEELRKALATNSGTGSNLIPEIVTAGVKEYVETVTPLYAAVTKLDWPTNSYTDRSRTALNSTAGALAEGATMLTASESTFTKPTWAMKSYYARGEVTGQMINMAGGEADAFQLEVEGAAKALVRAIEADLIDATGASNKLTGFFSQYTLAVTAGSTNLSLDWMDQLIDKPEGGDPTHLVMKRAYSRKIWGLLQAHQTFITQDTIEVKGGFRVPTYGGLPIIRADAGMIGGGLATGILAIDTQNCLLAVNTYPTYEELAKTKDSRDFMLKTYLTLACQGPSRYGAKLTGLNA